MQGGAPPLVLDVCVLGPVFMVTVLLLVVVVAVQENARREMEAEVVRE